MTRASQVPTPATTDTPQRENGASGPLSITPHQARYYALDLARRAHTHDVSAVGAGLFDAQVDLNPHQIEAALFGIRTSAESGRLLADEVGLGKTIEAALVLSQLWAERRRRLLVVAPAALRRQWVDELQKKFGLPARLVDQKSAGKEGRFGPGGPNPFEQVGVIVCSYQFAAKHATRVAAVSWDLVIIDEAHRLRNAWRATTGTGQALIAALTSVPKLMLTATPLQNSLIELFGLVTLLDPKALGDEPTFRARFLKGKTDYADLKQRLAPVCHRTLRREVLPYIRYTQRRPMTWRFSPSQAERELYRAVSDLLAKDTLHGLPNAQRALITMVLRKLLASSSAAIGGALVTLRTNLAAKRDALAESGNATSEMLDPSVFEDEGLDDEWLDDLEPLKAPADLGGHVAPPLQQGDSGRDNSWTMDDELEALDTLIALAGSIPTDKRALALVDALKVALAEAKSLGAAEKAVIFTESKRTQAALAKLLEAHYPGRIVCFNGTNDDPGSGAILDAWSKRNPQAAKEGSRAANIRQALVEHFRDHATLFIATEAGAEGLNLQFCSLVVNYDLPWNPQRLEQRIGRCHRYGQHHDVVVVNFLDKDNLADRRVLELLEDKIGLFSGVFGASDAVLGAVESGVGLERKIARIFQTCRTPDAIEAAFAELRREMDEVIRDKESKAKKALFEHFDDTVHDRLKIQLDLARARLDRMGRQFWALTRWALDDEARFAESSHTFELARTPPGLEEDAVPPGRYQLVTRGQRPGKDAEDAEDTEGAEDGDAFVYRMAHPLGEHVLERGRLAPVPVAELVFDLSRHPLKVSAVRGLVGKRGWLGLERLTIEGLSSEEHLLLSGFVEEGPGGSDLDPETLDRLLSVSATVGTESVAAGPEVLTRVEAGLGRLRAATLAAATERNSAEFEEARVRLERWSDDQIKAADVAIVEVRELLRALEKEARFAQTLDEKRLIEQKIGRAEEQRRKARAWVFQVEDEVAKKRTALLDELELRMTQKSRAERVFVAAWRVT